MKTNKSKWFALAGLAFGAFIFCAWQTTGSTLPVKPYLIRYDDTTAPRKKSNDKKDYKIGDLDQAMKELDKVMLDMDKNMKVDFSKMDREMKLAMEELKKVDFDKISRDVAASLKEVNWEKTRVEVDKALREAEVKMKEVDMKKIEKDIERVKEELKSEKISSHIDMEKIKRSVDEGLSKARVGIEKAKKELSLLKEFTDNLEKDGLINKKKGYKIEIKNGELYINGTKQSKEVNDKYRKYFKEEDYTIRSDGDEISSL